jgi:exopolyphosphatase/guanosine-5'-triphosphate,3'-diphosphate pyrophosphatase
MEGETARTRTARTSPRERAPVYAAIDVGTHNARMLVAAPRARMGFRIIDAFSRGVRLGEGLGATGRLAEGAMERALAALAVCAGRLRRFPVQELRAVATEACRRAVNGSEFLRRVDQETGIRLTPISPREEAALTLAGCCALLDGRTPRALLFDIGGGSTEVIWVAQQAGQPAKLLGSASLPHGVVSFAERFGSDRVTCGDYRAMVSTIDAGLGNLDRAHDISGWVARGQVQMLGSSGTVTTLAAVHLELSCYRRSRVDGLVVAFDDLARVSTRLAAADFAARAAVPCIGNDRADLVVAGCAILEAIRQRWPVGRLTVADRGIREGLLLAMMAAAAPPATAAAVRPAARGA